MESGQPRRVRIREQFSSVFLTGGSVPEAPNDPGGDPGMATLWACSNLMFVYPRIGATYGSRYSIWDLSNLQGGKPAVSGPGFAGGGHQFR